MKDKDRNKVVKIIIILNGIQDPLLWEAPPNARPVSVAVLGDFPPKSSAPAV